MTLLTNAFTSYSVVGDKEDLSDIIYMVSPTDTPFLASIPRTKAKQALHEWLTDTLASASQNAQLEGDEPSAAAATAATRLSNTCQIAFKVPAVTGTLLATDVAGQKDALAHQVFKRTLELRRDMENDLLANSAEVTGGATEARALGGVPTWITSNDSYGTGGSQGGLGNTAATNGTQREFTEDLLKTVLKSCWDNGGDPDCVMVGSWNKQKISEFTGNATRMIGAADEKLVAAVSIYRSDFGDLEVIPNRFQPARTALVLQKDMWAVSYLRSPSVQKLSKNGDSERRMVIAEYTLESRNEAASGAVFDLTTS